MKLGQLIEYNKRNIFLQKLWRKWGREISSRPLIFWKSLIWGKSKWSVAYFQYISIALNLPYNKNEHKTLGYWVKDMLSFSFSEKGLLLHHILCTIFQEKWFSWYMQLTDQILSSDCFYFSRYWAICALQFFVNQAVMS